MSYKDTKGKGKCITSYNDDYTSAAEGSKSQKGGKTDAKYWFGSSDEEQPESEQHSSGDEENGSASNNALRSGDDGNPQGYLPPRSWILGNEGNSQRFALNFFRNITSEGYDPATALKHIEKQLKHATLDDCSAYLKSKGELTEQEAYRNMKAQYKEKYTKEKAKRRLDKWKKYDAFLRNHGEGEFGWPSDATLTNFRGEQKSSSQATYNFTGRNFTFTEGGNPVNVGTINVTGSGLSINPPREHSESKSKSKSKSGKGKRKKK